MTERTPPRPELEFRVVDLARGGKRYCVLGADGGVDFHVEDVRWGFELAGLECHYRRCPTYMQGKEPFSEKCWLTGGRCWGDGTTTYATEYLLPLFQSMPLDVFRGVLEDEYRKRFSEREISFINESAVPRG